jgi:hypothetical protein
MPNDRIISVQEVDFKALTPEGWDAFAQSCGGSARLAYGRLMQLRLKALGRPGLLIYEIYAAGVGGREKIGQCALAISRRKSAFLDRLQLLPGHEDGWVEAMTAVLGAAGARSYEYGWQLNVEPPREADLAAIAGVAVQTVRPLIVHAVDFRRWPSWDAYYRALSENSRRNAKAAAKQEPSIALKTRFGRASLLSIPALTELRAAMAERKGLQLKVVLSALSYLGWIAVCPKYVVTNLAVGGGRVLATYFGIEFGGHTYYLEGASRAGNGGAAWYLILAMLRRAYDRDPAGKFIMGYIDPSTEQDEGLMRSRGACRVTDYPTSVVRFRYDPVQV